MWWLKRRDLPTAWKEPLKPGLDAFVATHDRASTFYASMRRLEWCDFPTIALKGKESETASTFNSWISLPY